jgi:hypothetical protein
MDADESGALSTEELSEGLATLGYQVQSLARPLYLLRRSHAAQQPRMRMTP